MFKLALIPILIWLVLIAGWVINLSKAITGIIALAHMSDIGGLLILRAVGIVVAPLGVAMGLFVW